MMKSNIKIILILVLSSLAAGCASTGKITRKPKVSVHAGLSHGGIVENTDMSVVPGAEAPPEATVDAFSGATRIGVNAGVRIAQPIGRIALETGVDYIRHNQQFNYIDAGHFAMGQRDLRVSQVAIPLRLQIPLFARLLPGADMGISAGYTGEINLIQVASSGILPDYSIIKWSDGLSVGFSMYPFVLENNSRLGIYVDLYRGSPAYEDYYNQASFEEPGTSFVKAGIAYKF